MKTTRKQLILHIVKVFTVAILLVGLFLTVYTVCSVRVSLVAYLDGQRLGAVDSPDVINDIIKEVRADVKNAAYGDIPQISGIKYYFEENLPVSEKERSDIYARLYKKVLSDFKLAYGLYINGELVAANTDASVISKALADFRLAAQGENDAELKLNGEINVVSMYYPESVLKADNEIFVLLKTNESRLFSVVKAENTSLDISYSEDEFNFFSSSPSSQTPGSLLGVELVSRDNNISSYIFKVKEAIPYKTEYEQTDTLYVGSYDKKCDGVNGEKTVEYSVTYENGIETSRTVKSETIILEPISKVVYEGTLVKPLTATVGTFICPMEAGTYRISSTFGWRKLFGKANLHRGLDFAAHYGTPIYAADGGLVITVAYNDSLGNHVMILHDNGYTTVYAHMSKALAVKGTRVAQGELIGKVGSTGIATGDHLHFEVRIGDTRYDPQDFLPQ